MLIIIVNNYKKQIISQDLSIFMVFGDMNQRKFNSSISSTAVGTAGS